MSQMIQLSLPQTSLERLSKIVPFDMLSTRNQSQASQLIQKIARNGTARAGDVLEMLILWTQSFFGTLTTFEKAGQGASGAKKAFGDYCLVTISGRLPSRLLRSALLFGTTRRLYSIVCPILAARPNAAMALTGSPMVIRTRQRWSEMKVLTVVGADVWSFRQDYGGLEGLIHQRAAKMDVFPSENKRPFVCFVCTVALLAVLTMKITKGGP